MFERINHVDGIRTEEEILFSTGFDYLFPEAARSRLCLVPDSEECTTGLRALGTAMAADSGGAPDESSVPAVYTYFGQFIDHDTTARTDREGGVTGIGRFEPVGRLEPDFVIANLRNGRRPDFDLDSIFGESPALVGLGGSTPARSQSQKLYDDDLLLHVYSEPGRRDVPRDSHRVAIIPDARNDENMNLSQLQCAMLAFYNAVHAAQTGSAAQRHVRARQLCRWAFQFVVVNDWLPTVCDPAVVADTLANGPRFVGAAAGRAGAFMPLEYSAAGFRFAHSMVRPAYRSNAAAPEVPIQDLLGFASNDTYFEPDSGGTHEQLAAEYTIDWNFFVRGGSDLQFARRIDTRIANGLGTLPFESRRNDPVLGHLARANLLRGKNLSIPTGQAMCDAFDLVPLSPAEITDGEDSGIVDVLEPHGFHHRSPLWYYVLREAAVQQDGERLGELGSRIVCETIIGFIKNDRNGYLSNRDDVAVKKTFIDVVPGPGGQVKEITDLLKVAGVYA